MFSKAPPPSPRPSRGRRRPRWRPAVEQLEERAVPAAVFTVNTLADETNPGDGLLSLREAITAANAIANPGPDVINFAAGLTGTINLTLAGADDLNAGSARRGSTTPSPWPRGPRLTRPGRTPARRRPRPLGGRSCRTEPQGRRMAAA